ncbi:MAG TPA: aminotransferase class IV [Propylenella sp.]|nr:aminotransferase class IV [Propylenella sp.]
MGQAEAIGIPLERARVREGWDAVLSTAEAEHVVLRTSVTRGNTGRTLWPQGQVTPTIVVSARPWNPQLFASPVRLVTSSIRRNHTSPASRLKPLGYLDNILAAREAAERGADDALFLNGRDQVACTTIANVFAIEGDRLITPPTTDGVLAGIMRGLVLAAATGAGLRPVEASLAPADLLIAEAVFLTNSVRFLSPAISLDGAPLADSGREAVTALQIAILASTRRECGYAPGVPT